MNNESTVSLKKNMLQYQSTAAQIDKPKKKGRPEANETHHTLG